MIQSLWRTVWRFLTKLNIELPYDPAIPLPGIYPEKTIIRKDTCTPMFTAALFTIAKAWKQPKCPLTEEWIKKIYIYTHSGILLSHKKNKIETSLVAQWLRIYLSRQGTRVRSLVWEDPTCRGASKPVCHNY